VKIISVSILLICLLAATFSSSLMLLSFDINQNYIAKNLCENRNNPNSHCNGHCYLCKQLAQQEKSGTASTSGKDRFEIQLFCIEGMSISNAGIGIGNTINPSGYLFSLQDYHSSLFRPPSA